MTFNAATGATGPSGPAGAPEDMDSLPAATTPLARTDLLQVDQASVEAAVQAKDVIPGWTVNSFYDIVRAGSASQQISFGLHSGISADINGGAQFSVNCYGGTPYIFGETAQGTVASPSASQSGDVLVIFSGYGYGATGFVYGATDPGMTIKAAGNFTDASAPTRIEIRTTPSGSVEPAVNLSIEANGTVIAAGTPTNDDAAAGKIGEYISSTLAIADGLDLVSGTAKTITSISLTAGDWDVWGVVGFTEATGTIGSQQIGAIHTTTNTLPTSPNGGAYAQRSGNTIASVGDVLPVGQKRISLASTTTVYLVASSTFTVSTNKGYGFIGARRVR